MKPIFEPEKCPYCGVPITIEHYETGWRVVCYKCPYYGIFHFDLPEEQQIIDNAQKFEMRHSTKNIRS